MCPVEAIDLDVELGPARPTTEEGLVRDEELCSFAGECAEICPTDAIVIDKEAGTFSMCTRCGACASICPTGALRVTQISKEVNGETVTRDRVIFIPSKCDECGDCIDVCPYDMLKLEEGAKVPIKGYCILCDKCIDACPSKALSTK
jgi:ferredoxin